MSKTNSNLIDMTKTGPLSYRQLRELNSLDRTLEVEELLQAPSGTRADTYGLGKVSYTHPSDGFDDFGSSVYDSELVGYDELLNRGDVRADAQPWYAKVGAGLAKGAILAGTTFLDGTIGLLVGGAEAISRGDISGLWDNGFSRAMQAVNEWSEEVMPNYYSQDELNSPWYENIFTANFIGDKFIKNLGFSIGALYSGGVTAAGLKLTKLPQLIGAITKSSKAPAAVSSLVGATVSAVNEGRIEALNNSKDWQDLKIQELDDAWREQLNSKYAPQMEALKEEYQAAFEEYKATKGTLQRVSGDSMGFVDPAAQRYQAKVATLDARRAAIENGMKSEWDNRDSNDTYRKVIGKIEEDRLKMGNTDMLLNLPILTASNLVQFTKFYANGFNTARRAGVKTVKDTAEGTVRYVGKSFSKGKAAFKVTKGALAEGTEEISQKAASLVAGDYYSTDVDNFYKAQMNPDAEQETLDWMKSFANGINETVNDGSSWEEFFIGALTGLIGIPSFRSMKNADGSFRLPITLEGGAFNEIKEYNKEVARSQEVANYLNQRVQSPEFLNYYRGIIRHNKYQNDMNRAVEEDDEFNFKNAEHAQFVSDIVMFDNAGKLEDLRTYIDSAYDMSDENLQSIVENTTTTDGNGKKVGPFVDSNGNPLYATEEGKQQMIDKLTKTRDNMISTLDNYRRTKNDLDVRTGGNLSDEQLAEMTWLKTQVDDWSKRASDMTPLIKNALTDLSNNLENSLIRALGDASMEEPSIAGESMDIISEAANQLGIGIERIQQLRGLSRLSDERLAAILTSPKNEKFVEGLLEDISSFGSDIISALDKQNVIRLLSDLPKIGKGIETFNKKLEEYLADPAKLEADQAQATGEVRQEVQSRKSQDIRTSLSSATSLGEFREAFNQEEDAELKEGVLNGLIGEGNQVAKNYRETEQYNTELRKALQSQGEDAQTVEDALALWNEQYRTAENLEQIAYPNSIVLNNETAFDEASEGDVALSEQRFQNARYAIQRAMSKVNNDIKFKNRFSEEYRKPVDEKVQGKGTDRDETGDSGTPTVPHVNPDVAPVEVPSVPVGNVTAEMVADENSDANRRIETQRTLDQSQQGQRKYYRPAVPELHIEASKEGDFRPFDVVVGERERGVDFSGIYSYLRDNGAFNYVNAAKLKPGDTLGFMIDPEFNDHTIFLVDTRNNQIVGSIDESDASVARYEGLEGLIKKVRDEYQASRSGTQSISDTLANIISVAEANKEVGDRLAANANVIGMSASVSLVRTKIGYLNSILEKGEFTDEDIARIDSLLDDIFGALNSLISAHNNGAISDEAENLIKDLASKIANKVGSKLDNYAERHLAVIKEKAVSQGRSVEINKTTSGDIMIDGNLLWVFSSRKSSTPSVNKFFATPQVRVSKMMVGRIPFTSEERSLADIPGVLDGDAKPVFGIIKNGVLTTNEKIDDRLIIKPVDMSQKEGRLYLLIPNAAGTYSPAAVRVKHFNTQEFNLDDATVANTPVGKGISEALDKLSDATSQDDVSIAMKELASDIYMQDVMVTWFDAKAGSGIVISKKVRKPDGTYEMVTINGQEQIKEEKTTVYYQSSKKSIEVNGLEYTFEAAQAAGVDMSLFGQPRDTSDIRKDILNTILRYNLPLQVSASKINETGYNNRVIKSNILTSNLREAKVIGSWFTTDYFDNQGNLQKAVSPSSIKPAPSRRVSSPVGGTEGVVQGTRVTVSGTSYIVDLKHSIAVNEKTGEKRAFSAFNSQSLIDLAWAQENFGDATESSIMTENKIITPKGNVLDRTTGHYVTGEEAQRIKDKIAGRDRDNEAKVAQSKRVIANIYENQKKVDKTKTDSQYYYILEEDGQYHQYSRVHSRLGDNWTGERTETENSRRALEAGTTVDRVIRDFFTSKETPVKPDTLSEAAFIDLISKLTEIKSKMEQLGETFMADNIVLFQKYADGTRVAGEVDILSVDKNGNFKIYDVKTSRYSFSDRYFTEKSSKQRMSTKDYYTLQLSAYQNLFESQYGVRPTRLAILPFVLSYSTTQATAIDIPSGAKTKLGLPVASPTLGYFRTDRKVDDGDVRFVSSEKGGKAYFKPVLDTKAHEKSLVSTDAARSVVEFVGGDPKEATSLILVEAGEATKNASNGRLEVTKKAKVFVVTPSTPYSNTRSVVSSITGEKGILINYNPAVNVPLASAVQAPQQQSTLPIFDSAMETMITNSDEQNRVLPENAFEEGGEIGYYEKDGKLYTGYLKKVGEIEVTYGSGQKDMVPIHLTKVRDRGFGREGEFGSTSEYLTVFPNGMAISTRTNDTNDDHAAKVIMEALSKNPSKVLTLSSEKTQIHNPRALEEMEAEARNRQYSGQSGASRTVQKEDIINNHDEEFEDDLVLYDDFFDNPNYGKDIVRVDGLEARIGQDYTISKAEELFHRFVTLEQQEELSYLADRVFRVADNLGIKVVFSNDFSFGVKGAYSSNNTIRLNYKFFTDDFLNHTKAPIILHEMIHAITMYILSDKTQDRVTGNLKEAADAIRAVYDSIKDDPSLVGEYGVSNAKEMIAEMANPRFRTKLKKLNVWQRIKEAIKKLFSLDKTSSAFDTLNAALDLALDSFDIDLYNDYVGAKTYGSYNPNDWAFYREATNREKAEVSSEVRNWAGGRVYQGNSPNIMIDDLGNGYILTWDGLYTYHYEAGRDVENIKFIYKNSDRNRGRIQKFIDNFYNNAYFESTNYEDNSSWKTIPIEARQALEAKGWTQEKFDSISQREREQAVECVGL